MVWCGHGYSFINSLAEDANWQRNLSPKIITGRTGWMVVLSKDKACNSFRSRNRTTRPPYDGYDEADDTQEKAKMYDWKW